MTVARVDLNQSEIRKLADSDGMEAAALKVAQDVAERVNDADARTFNPGEGGGIGSFEAHTARDKDGVYAYGTYPPENFYMWIHQFGSEHEKPRPTVLPALFTPQRGTT